MKVISHYGPKCQNARLSRNGQPPQTSPIPTTQVELKWEVQAFLCEGNREHWYPWSPSCRGRYVFLKKPMPEKAMVLVSAMTMLPTLCIRIISICHVCWNIRSILTDSSMLGSPPNKQIITTTFVEPCHVHPWNSSKKYFILRMGKLMFRNGRLQAQGHVTKRQAETEPHVGLPGSKSWDLSTMEDSYCGLSQVRWKKCMVSVTI